MIRLSPKILISRSIKKKNRRFRVSVRNSKFRHILVGNSKAQLTPHELLVKRGDPLGWKVVEDIVVGCVGIDRFPIGHVVEVDMLPKRSRPDGFSESGRPDEDKRFRSWLTRVLED